MKRVVAVALLALAAAMLASAGWSSAARVRLMGTKPVAVSGSGFVAGETVAVRVTSGVKTLHGTTRSGANGSWRLTFPASSASRCGSITILAVGSTNDRARLALASSCGPANP